MAINFSNKIAIAAVLSLVLSAGCSAVSSDSADTKGASSGAETTAAADPCAADPCAADPCAAASDPCAADPCAAAADPCAASGETAKADSSDAIEVRYFEKGGLAIRGYDPVAYFTDSAPVAGSGEFTHEWGNATWQFASAENRDLFAADPEKYAPQYGGFCAWAVSQGYTADVDPEAWRVVDGKLYLNYSKGVQKRWEKDIPGNINKANNNWPGVLVES